VTARLRPVRKPRTDPTPSPAVTASSRWLGTSNVDVHTPATAREPTSPYAIAPAALAGRRRQRWLPPARPTRGGALAVRPTGWFAGFGGGVWTFPAALGDSVERSIRQPCGAHSRGPEPFRLPRPHWAWGGGRRLARERDNPTGTRRGYVTGVAGEQTAAPGDANGPELRRAQSFKSAARQHTTLLGEGQGQGAREAEGRGQSAAGRARLRAHRGRAAFPRRRTELFAARRRASPPDIGRKEMFTFDGRRGRAIL